MGLVTLLNGDLSGSQLEAMCLNIPGQDGAEGRFAGGPPWHRTRPEVPPASPLLVCPGVYPTALRGSPPWPPRH